MRGETSVVSDFGTVVQTVVQRDMKLLLRRNGRNQ
jgi:hypothetical protein